MGSPNLSAISPFFFPSVPTLVAIGTKGGGEAGGGGQKRGLVRDHVLKRGWFEGGAESGRKWGSLGGSAGRKGARGLARLGH